MQPLDLYASIEEYLDFEEQIDTLYKKIGSIVLSKGLTNLIDIGCGQGEFARLLEHNGVSTFGVDLSAKQIKIASAKGLNVKCIDIKDIKQKYSCATAVFDVVNYLDDAYLKQFFTYTYDLLKDDGYFIFDINSNFGFSEVAVGALTIDIGEKFIAIDANFDDNKLYTDITLFTKNKSCYTKHSGTIVQYYHTNEILKNILQQVGFTVEKIEGFNLHGFDEDDKYIFICKKGNI